MHPMAPFQLLNRLPEELLLDILERLLPQDLKQLNLVSSWGYSKATPLIWRDVELVDCRTHHDGNMTDEHDDTAIIRKLLLFAKNSKLASWVHSITHRCHLPPPSIFNELPRMTFSAQTLSTDPRTIKLVQLAAKNMDNVQTLRITLGHPTLTDALLRCLFDSRRTPDKGYKRIQKLWLENCRISVGLTMSLQEHPYDLPLDCTFIGLESVRFRRLPMKPGGPFFANASGYNHSYSRGGTPRFMQDGVGGQYVTTTNSLNEESRAGDDHILALTSTVQFSKPPLDLLYELANRYDDIIYERLATIADLPAEVRDIDPSQRCAQAYRGSWLDPDDLTSAPGKPDIWKKMQRERIPSAQAAITMLRNTSSTLTSLNLDWILNIPISLGWSRNPAAFASWCGMFSDLLNCRFPHLRAFQLRNCIVPDTQLPDGLYLLDSSTPVNGGSALINSSGQFTPVIDPLAGLAFMEAHPKLQCLSWPMYHFFGPGRRKSEITERVDAVIDNLSRTLTDLRVDALYSQNGEPMSDESEFQSLAVRESRRRFITDFAARMTRIESIKIEGGVPRDERRELMRALHQCPLKKIVMIGVCSPLGNTWGLDGIDIRQVMRMDDNDVSGMEGEDKAVVHHLGVQKPTPPAEDYKFTAQYEWQGTAPMLHVLASYHAETVRELKFCGYKGCPVLFNPTPITNPILAALKHFNNLESFIMSMWLPTLFEGDHRDADVISYWCNARNPASTALVRMSDDDPEGWEKELITKYAPNALAWRVTNFIGPYLSEDAKKRKGGVHVRASFCVGDWGGIFDLDLQIGKGACNSDVCLGFKGPREELEDGRRKGKMMARRWF